MCIRIQSTAGCARASTHNMGVARRLIQVNSGKPNVLLKNRQIEKQRRKVARTIADLAASDDINTTHLTETIFYRRQDRRQTS